MEICIILAILLRYHKTIPNQPTVATKDGVLFNLHQKLLLTWKFVKTEILVPYHKYNKTVEEKFVNLSRAIAKTLKKYVCPLNFTNMTDSTAGLLGSPADNDGKQTSPRRHWSPPSGNEHLTKAKHSNKFKLTTTTPRISSRSCKSRKWNWRWWQTTLLYKIGLWRMW